MGLIQPLAPSLLHTQGILLTLISMKSNVLHLKKMLPSDKCPVILYRTITYVLGNITCLLNLLKCLLLFLGLIFNAAT